MNKRDFLHVLGAGALGVMLPGAALAQAKKPAKPAGALPDKFMLKGVDVGGTPINLDDYAGKAVLVSFFTTECIPCTNDLRLMREFFGANKKRGYVNIAVNMDVDRAAIAEYMDLTKKIIPPEQHFPIAWRNAKDHSDNFGAITSEPTHFLLNKDHKLVTRRDGVFKPADWDDLWTKLG